MNTLRIPFVFLLLSLFVFSCGNSSSTDTSDAADSVLQVKPFAVEKYYLGLYDGQEVEEVSNNVFSRGDKVFFALRNISGITRGNDELYYIDISMKITNSIGELIALHTYMYGDKGHKDFENGVVKKPFAAFLTDVNMPVGTYNFELTVHDKVVNDSLVFMKEFILE